MGREMVKMKRKPKLKLKLKRSRRDLTKKVIVLCDFCELSSSSSRRYEQRPHKQDDEAVSMESQLQRLRLLTRRMIGKDLEGLSFAELLSLKDHLDEVLLIVSNQKKKIILEEDVKLRNQNKEAGDEVEGRRKTGILAPCKFSRSSSGERQEKKDDETQRLAQMQLEYERRKAESMQSEYERLWLLKERMNGRELVGMTSSELYLLLDQIHRGLRGVLDYLGGTRF